MTTNPAWSRGYTIDFGYTQSFAPEAAPLHLDYVLASRGCRPPDATRPFTYGDLGCGRGVMLCLLAATHPHGTFVGYDFMPGHVAAARRLAGEAGLDNVRFEEMDFASLADGADPEPDFDYVALHGVYSWVNAETRRDIVRVLGRRTRPGAAVYVGYNAMPGWLYLEPLRRMFRQAAQAVRTESAAEAANAGRAAVDAWLELDPTRPVVAEAWKRLGAFSGSYLMHELGVTNAGGLWADDVADDLAAAKLRFVALARLIENFDALQFPGEFRSFLQQSQAGGYGNVARDILRNQLFRTDVFYRGLPDMNPAEMRQVLDSFLVMAAGDVGKTSGEDADSPVDFDIDQRLSQAVLDAVGEGASRVCELDCGTDEATRMKVVAAMLALGRLRVAAPPEMQSAAVPAAARLTDVARERLRLDAVLPALPSPRLASAISLSADEQRMLFGDDPATADERRPYAALGLLVGDGRS